MTDRASAQSEDYDSPWKDVLTRIFPEFTLFFFPRVHAEIDWARMVRVSGRLDEAAR